MRLGIQMMVWSEAFARKLYTYATTREVYPTKRPKYAKRRLVEARTMGKDERTPPLKATIRRDLPVRDMPAEPHPMQHLRQRRIQPIPITEKALLRHGWYRRMLREEAEVRVKLKLLGLHPESEMVA